MLHSICQQIWTTQQWPQGGKRSVFIPIPKKGSCTMYSSNTQAKWCSKFSKPGFDSTWTVNFQMFKLDLEKAEDPDIKLPTSVGSSKKQESSSKTSTSALLTGQNLWLCGSQQTVENSSRDGITRAPYLPSEKSVCSSRSNRTGHGTTD